MGLRCSFDVVDDFGFIPYTPEYGIIPDYSEGNDVFCEIFLEVANSLVPVDTGYLQSSLDATSTDTSCECLADCDYAQYPEYGTWCQSPQPYFEPAIQIALGEAEPLWVEAMEQAMLEEELLLEEEREEKEAVKNSQSGSLSRIGAGGLNFSSVSAFLGSVLALFVTAAITVTVQAMSGADFSTSGRAGFSASGGAGGVFMPEVEIF